MKNYRKLGDILRSIPFLRKRKKEARNKKQYIFVFSNTKLEDMKMINSFGCCVI